MNDYYKSKAIKLQHLYSENLYFISKEFALKQKLYFVCKETRLGRKFRRDLNENLSENRTRIWSRIWIHIIMNNSTAILRIHLFDWLWLIIMTYFSVNFDSFQFIFFKQYDLRCLKKCQKDECFSKEKRNHNFYSQLQKLLVISFHQII